MKSLFFVPVFFISLNLLSQTVSSTLDLRPFLYRTFVAGKVIMKTGDVEEAEFNYNTNNQSLVFVNNQHFLELTGLENIKEVQLDKKIFIPILGKFYEVTSDSSLLISYSNKGLVRAARTDKSGTERVASAQASNDVSNIYLSRKYQDLNNVLYIKNYWFSKNNKLLPLNDVKHISKSFGIDKNDLMKFIESNKLDIQQDACMIEIVRKWAH